MDKSNKVFIAVSLDGYIADKNGGIDWLNTVPNPDNTDMGYEDFMSNIDALIMGRATFEKVLSFGIDWPYKVPVFVASSTLKEVPGAYTGKVEIVSGTPKEILSIVHGKGFNSLYLDGGLTIQRFLKEDLIDELTLTTIPVLLGGGFPLFSDLDEEIIFEHIKTTVYFEKLVQSNYRRKKEI